MPINFVNGSQITLRESLEFNGRGSRTPHPGWENTMTTILAQLGVPIELCWEVRADLKGYRVTHLGGRRISQDDAKCGPWAQFDVVKWATVRATLPGSVQSVISTCRTPFQAHMAVTKAAFPHIQTSADLYLRHRELVQKALDVLAHSRFREHFAKYVDGQGYLHPIYQAHGNTVYYQGNHKVHGPDLEGGYMRLLEFVKASQKSGAQVAYPAWGVVPDARILCLLDMVVYALSGNTDHVHAWSGTSMMQYILREADSQRWREIVSGMYDLVRRTALPQLPRDLSFTLIPTLGLGNLAITDRDRASKVNDLLRGSRIGGMRQSTKDRAELQEMARSDPDAFLRYVRDQVSSDDFGHIADMLRTGNWKGAGGKASARISFLSAGQTGSPVDKEELGRLLRDENGKCILQHQAQVDALLYVQGTRLYVLDGVLDTPTGKLDSLRARLANIALKGQRRDTSEEDSLLPYFSRAGWMFE